MGNTKTDIVEKAWEVIIDGYSSNPEIIYGDSRSAVKTSVFHSVEPDEKFLDFCNRVNVRRTKYFDKLPAIQLDIIGTLSDNQVHILSHSNGNSETHPGNRSYYNISNQDNADLNHLVLLNLMTGPHSAFGGSSYYYHLTPFGTESAFSLLPIQRGKLEHTLKHREKFLSWMELKEPVISDPKGIPLMMLLFNPNLIEKLKEIKVRIFQSEIGQYWRPNSAGHTQDGLEAGIYNFNDAFNLTRGASEKGFYFKPVISQ